MNGADSAAGIPVEQGEMNEWATPRQTTSRPSGLLPRIRPERQHAFLPGPTRGRWTTICAALAATLTPVSVADGEGLAWQDPANDAVVRRADIGADGPVDPLAHKLPDILSLAIGEWQPATPDSDLFTGQWSSGADFFRVDLVFNGLVNPPGTLGHGYPFDPFQHGPNPVFGYVEIDIDGNVATGGELDSPNLRYLGNAARFGGLPAYAAYAGHAAQDASAFDGSFDTPPFVERSGEEFHIAFHGWEITQIARSSEANLIFDPGETWTVYGKLFHRAHGYEPFSYACCSGVLGSYEPDSQIQFHHDAVGDETTVSLVYPLTNLGSAAMRGEGEVQPLDGDASNQSSVLEALDDLVFSVVNAPVAWRNNPRFPIIAEWEFAAPENYLDPQAWRITALVATAYTAPGEDAMFVWTDLAPDVRVGDFNSNGLVDAGDLDLFDAFLATYDGVVGVDADGAMNGQVQPFNFSRDFSLFDTDYDGVVDQADRPALAAGPDLDKDGDVDLSDFGCFELCFGATRSPPAPLNCGDADLDGDSDIDLTDLGLLQACFNGPDAAPACGS